MGGKDITFSTGSYLTNTILKDAICVYTGEDSLQKIPKGSLVIAVFLHSEDYRIFHYITKNNNVSIPPWVSDIVSQDMKRLAKSIKKNHEGLALIKRQMDMLQDEYKELRKKIC